MISKSLIIQLLSAVAAVPLQVILHQEVTGKTQVSTELSQSAAAAEEDTLTAAQQVTEDLAAVLAATIVAAAAAAQAE